MALIIGRYDSVNDRELPTLTLHTFSTLTAAVPGYSSPPGYSSKTTTSPPGYYSTTTPTPYKSTSSSTWGGITETTCSVEWKTSYYTKKVPYTYTTWVPETSVECITTYVPSTSICTESEVYSSTLTVPSTTTEYSPYTLTSQSVKTYETSTYCEKTSATVSVHTSTETEVITYVTSHPVPETYTKYSTIPSKYLFLLPTISELTWLDESRRLCLGVLLCLNRDPDYSIHLNQRHRHLQDDTRPELLFH